jgi:hypothetical protein
MYNVTKLLDPEGVWASEECVPTYQHDACISNNPDEERNCVGVKLSIFFNLVQCRIVL